MDQTTRAAAISAPGDPELLERLSDSDPRVREAAVHELYGRRDADPWLAARCRAMERAWLRSRSRRPRAEEIEFPAKETR
jgi:hypothetical protein